jgi:endo-1,4-beta-xylanase
MVSRRETLTMALNLAAAIAMPARSKPEAAASLNTLAGMKGMTFGSAVSAGSRGSINDPNYAALLVAECGLLVPENELKWRAIHPDRGRFDFSRFDRILDFAQAHGLTVRGHNLLWQRSQWMPEWLERYDFGPRPAAEAERLLRTHITTVCSRYRGRIKSYDVVNEAVLPENGDLAQTALSRAIGGSQTLLDLAFHTAHDAAPEAQLVYNDYMSWESANDAHRDGVRKLLEGFRRREVPVDALGVQSHITVQDRPQQNSWRRFMDDVEAMGYDVLITEFDINDQHLAADTLKRDRAVAAYARDYLDLMFDYRRLRDVLVWGMCDSASWLQYFKPLRADGLPKRPCPYDANFHPKPLRRALAGAFMAASSRGEGPPRPLSGKLA